MVESQHQSRLVRLLPGSFSESRGNDLDDETRRPRRRRLGYRAGLRWPQITGPGSHNPSSATGVTDGNQAASLIRSEGFVLGSSVYLDLKNGRTSSHAAAYRLRGQLVRYRFRGRLSSGRVLQPSAGSHRSHAAVDMSYVDLSRPNYPASPGAESVSGSQPFGMWIHRRVRVATRPGLPDQRSPCKSVNTGCRPELRAYTRPRRA
jgi:hypothetical protein